MAEYQNIFTQVQVRGPVYAGLPLPVGNLPRVGKGSFSYWFGKIGDAQIGPIYLGFTGVASLICGFIAIEIIEDITSGRKKTGDTYQWISISVAICILVEYLVAIDKFQNPVIIVAMITDDVPVS